MDNRKQALERWAPILGGMGITGSKAEWFSEYAQMHADNEADLSNTQSHEATFPSVLPMAMKVSAQTVGLDLVSVVPIGSNTQEEIEKIKAEVAAENRDRKIDSVVEGKEFEEMEIQEHPDFVPGPRGELFYLDYSYGGTQSGI